MQYTDSRAAAILTQLREDQGLSPEHLSRAIFEAGHGYVSGRTIRNIEGDPSPIPTLRVRMAIARYFERHPRTIWATAPAVMPRQKVAA